MKIIRLSVILQSSLAALLQCSQAHTPKEKEISRYLKDTYLSPSSGEGSQSSTPSTPPDQAQATEKSDGSKEPSENQSSPSKSAKMKYVRVYGIPQKAQSVLVVFTAMACPICSEFHQNILPRLKTYIKSHPDKLAVIVRDYPSDPLSLKTSAVVWRYPRYAPSLMEHLFKQSARWVTLSEADSIEKVKQLAKNIITDPEMQKGVDQATGDQNLLKKIFEERVKDKTALGITVVPTLFIVQKSPERTRLMDNPPSYEAIMKLIQELPTSEEDTAPPAKEVPTK